MSASTDQLFLEACALSPGALAELIDRLIAKTAAPLAPEIERTHLEEVRRRMARVESGEVQLLPGEQVMAEGRALLADLISHPPMRPEHALLFKLPVPERLRLVEDLWDSIAQEDTSLPLADWQHDELRRREHFIQNPDLGLTWERVKQHAREQEP